MQSLMQQMTGNPELMQGLLNSPQTQAMMRTLSENPDLAASMIGNNPLLAGNPEMQEQMRNMMPAFMQQLQNPAVQVRKLIIIQKKCYFYVMKFLNNNQSKHYYLQQNLLCFIGPYVKSRSISRHIPNSKWNAATSSRCS